MAKSEDDHLEDRTQSFQYQAMSGPPWENTPSGSFNSQSFHSAVPLTSSIWPAGSFSSFDGLLSEAPSLLRSEANRVSVLVTARNYARFLGECLTSIQNQTHPPLEIIYSDDGSVDGSVNVARAFPGVRILARPHEGIAASRNAAVAASSGEFLLHVDGDDVLSPDFIRQHLQALQSNPEATFAYGPAQGFGIRNNYWDRPAWSRTQLWIRNYVNTSALYRRWAFEAAGGWRIGVGTCFDWDLALRASRFGPAVPSQACLQYRQHSASWSRAFWNHRSSRQEIVNVHARIRQQAASVTIGCVYSGRLPDLLPKWLEALARTVNNTDLPYPNLLFVDGTPTQSAGELLLNAASRHPEFREVHYVRATSPIRLPIARSNRDDRASFMASACNQILDGCTSDVIWFVEDDVLVPEESYSRLLWLLMRGDQPRPAVAGAYRSRHAPGSFVAHQWGERIETLQKLPREAFPVDLTGTGCLMIFRPFARHRFQSHVQGIAAHDWAWCRQLTDNGSSVMIDPQVLCQHFLDGTTAV